MHTLVRLTPAKRLSPVSTGSSGAGARSATGTSRPSASCQVKGMGAASQTEKDGVIGRLHDQRTWPGTASDRGVNIEQSRCPWPWLSRRRRGSGEASGLQGARRVLP